MRATRLAIGLFFFGDGLMIGSWAGRIPAVQHHAGLTTSRLGLALFAASLGALVAMPVAGRLCERVGSRSITLVGASARRRLALRRVALDRPRRALRCAVRLRRRLRDDQRRRQRAGRRARAACRAAGSSRRSTPRSRPAASSERARPPSSRQPGSASSSTTARWRSFSPRSRSSGSGTCSRPRPTTGPRRGRRAAGSRGRHGRSSCSAPPRSARCSPREPPSTGAPSTCRARSGPRPASRRSPTPRSRS